MDGTQQNRFGAWLREQLGERKYGQLAAYVEVQTSTVSRWVTGENVPEYRNILRIARYFKVEPGVIEELLADDEVQRRGAHVPGLGPTGALVDDIADAVVQRVMGQLIRQIGSRPAESAHAAYGPGEAAAITARLLELASGGVRPVLVDDPAILAEVTHAGRGVAWLEPSTAPAPGKIVRVGLEEPPRLKPYEAGDDVTGVVLILQVSPNTGP